MRYRGVYPGVDVVYYGKQRQLEYDFVLTPGSGPHQIRLVFGGAQRMRGDSSGDLVLHGAGSEPRQNRQVIYQEVYGREIEVRNAIRS